MLTDLMMALAHPSPGTRDQVGAAALAEFFRKPITEQLKLLTGDLGRLSDDEKGPIVKALAGTLHQPFVPLPGPQQAALESQADELLYGGAAGGGKSALLVGASLLGHKRGLIVRRQSVELEGLVAELHEMAGRDGWKYEGNGGVHTQNNKQLRFGGMQHPDDWRTYAGRARDFMGFDEAGEFLEEQVSSLIAWLRSADPNQRCRVIFASNPPRGAEGEWLIEWFSPWLDPGFPRLAHPGELRWFIRVNSKTTWVDGPGRYEVDGENYTARSRTFIPARLDDNPFLSRTGYRATLENLREPLRSQLLRGDFLAGRQDDAWQVIPSDWLTAAQLRWQPHPPQGVPMTSIGVDVAQGGPDQTVLAPRHGNWFATPIVHDGIDTKDGPAVAALVFTAMRDGCDIAVDMGGGWGGSTYDHLKAQLGEVVKGVVPGAGSTARSRNGIHGYFNKRAEIWFKFAEALDPSTGAYVALPPDQALIADLRAPRWEMTTRGYKIEDKDDIRKRLGRSPDRGDAVVMAWAHGVERSAERTAIAKLQTRTVYQTVRHMRTPPARRSMGAYR